MLTQLANVKVFVCTQGAPTFIPGEQELRADLTALKTWRDEYVARPVGEQAHV